VKAINSQIAKTLFSSFSILALIVGLIGSLNQIARAQTIPSSAHNVGEFAQSFDGGFGHPVYVLSDSQLCPKGATHTYSYTREFSIQGDMIFTCNIDPTNSNISRFIIYDSNFKLVYKDVVRDSGHTQFNQSDFGDPQFSQKRRVVFAQRQMRIYEFDPWNGTNRVYADFSGLQFTIPAGQQYAGTHTSNVMRAPKIGPNDEIVVEMGATQGSLNPSSTCPACFEIIGIATFNPSTGQISTYSIRGDGKGNDHPLFSGPSTQGFDETNITQDSRIFSTYNTRPSWSFNLDFSNPIEFRMPSFGPYGSSNRQWSAHGHMGFFNGSNGKSYVVKVINDLIDDNNDGKFDRVGQVGTSVNGVWRSVQELVNTKTGQVELVWGVNKIENGWADGHYSRSLKADVFWGSNAAPGNITRYQIFYDSSGNPNNVTGENISKSQSNLGCGYWAHPRVTSDDSGNRGLFDSTVASGCTTQVYVAVKSGTAPPPPPPPVADTTAPTISMTAPTNGSSVSGITTISANASDNNGVAGVQFLINGNNLGIEDTTPPYSTSWNTTSVANGAHALSARARDFSGNQTTSAGVSVTVNNVTLSTPADGTLLLYITLDNSSSVTSPQTGTGAGASLAGTPTFVAGQVGQAMNIDANQEYARFQLMDGVRQNAELTKGTVEFWYKPNYNHNDGLRHNIFSIGSFGSPGSITLVKGGGNELGLFYFDSTGTGKEASEISGSNYSWTAGQWVKIRATWDFTVSSGIQNTRIYLNDTERTYGFTTTGPVSMPAESMSQHIYIGNRSTTDGNHADGVFDEFKIWSGALAPGSVTPPPPPPPPPGGDTTPPIISIISPANGASVLGSINIVVSASDNTGVAGVQFKLDSANLGIEDISAPYELLWDTTKTTNGSHVLTAIARDAAGNQTTSGLITVNVNNQSQDTTPPTISSVQATNIAQTSAVITWSTNEPADTQVQYGTSPEYGQISQLDPTPVTSHVVNLTNLGAGTNYYYRVKSKDAAGNLSTSGQFTFSTLAQTPQTLSVSLTANPTSGIRPLNVSLVADVSGSASGNINYTFYCNRSDSATNVTNPYDYKFDNTTEDPKIVSNACSYSTAGNYMAKVIVERGTASPAEARVSITVTDPPIISVLQLLNILATNITANSADITWNTNAPANSRVDYGTSPSYGLFATNNNLVSNHLINLTGLLRKTTYNFQVKSTDANNNTAISQNLTFKTAARLGKPPKVRNVSATQGSVILTWENPIEYEFFSGVEVHKSSSGYIQNPSQNSRAFTSQNAQTWTDVNTTAGQTYYYSLFTKDDLGVFSDPEYISFSTSNAGIGLPPPPPPPPKIGGGTTGSRVVITPPTPTTPSIPATPPTPPSIGSPGAGTGTFTPPIDSTKVSSDTKIFSRDLSISSRHEEVVLLQKALQELNYFPKNELPTNYFGPLTQRALIGYQKTAGLPQTGILDSQTRTSLNALSSGQLSGLAQKTETTNVLSKDLSLGSRGEEVSKLQTMLKGLGFFPANEETTDYFGPITQRALQKFQQANSIYPADGSLRINSRSSLNRLGSLAPELFTGEPNTNSSLPVIPPPAVSVSLGRGANQFTKLLFRGLTDSEVVLLQKTLIAEDVYPEGIVSGFFGSLTERAVQRFQEKHGIVAGGNPGSTGYGLVGPSTRTKLNEIISKTSSQAPGINQPASLPQQTSPTATEQILELQQQLRQLQQLLEQIQ